jgi:hypothetical protein
VTSTPACSILNASGRVASLRAQPLSGSRSPRSPRTRGEPQRYGSPTLGSSPCSAPRVSPLNTVGFTHRSLRAHVSQLLGADYNTNQMSHDLARLHINALIQRREHTNTYDLTPEDQQAAVFYTKAHDRLLRPPAGRQPTTRTTRATPRPGHHRPTRPHLHRPRPPRKRSLKTQDTSMSSCHQAMARVVAGFPVLPPAGNSSPAGSIVSSWPQAS